MSTWRFRLALLLTYVVFAILLNSVGTVILQAIAHYGVSKPQAAILEAFKDLSIAGVSFLVASFLPRFGFRRAMMTGLTVVAVAAIAMRVADSFLATEMLFLATGVAFALVKVSAYATIGLFERDPRKHAGFMNLLEGMFMIGVLSGYWLFGHFIDREAAGAGSWLEVYPWLAGLALAVVALLAASPLDESAARTRSGRPLHEDFLDMLRLAARPLVYVFVIAAFLYVLVEQGIGTWLPTFNREVLGLPAAMSVEAASIYAAGLAAGRLGAGWLLGRLDWYPVLNACLAAMAVLVLLALPLTRDLAPMAADAGWGAAPAAAFLFPLIGLFMAPLYPAMNSLVLSALPPDRHAAMTGLIVIFSALGGTFGSLMTGLVFERFDGQTAFYLSLLPIAGIALTLFFFRRARAGALAAG